MDKGKISALSPNSVRYSAYGSTAWTSPQGQRVSQFSSTAQQGGAMPSSFFRRNKSEGPFSNRFHQPWSWTRKSFCKRTESQGVSACLGVNNSVMKYSPPSQHPGPANASVIEELGSQTFRPSTSGPTRKVDAHQDFSHINDVKEVKKFSRYTPTFSSTAFSGYNLHSPMITSKKIQNEIIHQQKIQKEAAEHKRYLQESETPRGNVLDKRELQNKYQTPLKEQDFQKKPRVVKSQIPKQTLRLMQKRKMEIKSGKNAYYEQLKHQADARHAFKHLDKLGDKKEAQQSLGFNYECYRRDQFIAEQRARLNSHLKQQMLDRVKAKAEQKHELQREKLMKDQEFRRSDINHRVIKDSDVFNSPIKSVLEVAKAAGEKTGNEDVVRAAQHSLQYVLRDGLMSKEKQKLMSTYLLKQIHESRRTKNGEKKKYNQWDQ